MYVHCAVTGAALWVVVAVPEPRAHVQVLHRSTIGQHISGGEWPQPI